jgi:hypothetical protein
MKEGELALISDDGDSEVELCLLFSFASSSFAFDQAALRMDKLALDTDLESLNPDMWLNDGVMLFIFIKIFNFSINSFRLSIASSS